MSNWGDTQWEDGKAERENGPPILTHFYTHTHTQIFDIIHTCFRTFNFIYIQLVSLT